MGGDKTRLWFIVRIQGLSFIALVVFVLSKARSSQGVVAGKKFGQSARKSVDKITASCKEYFCVVVETKAKKLLSSVHGVTFKLSLEVIFFFFGQINYIYCATECVSIC